MIALTIILLIILLILLMPVGVDGSYVFGELMLSAKAGPIKIRILPTKPGREKADKPPKKEEKIKPQKEKEQQKTKLTFNDIKDIIKLGLKALGRLRRSLSIDVLMIHISVSSDDPYNAVLKYGCINAAIGALLPPLHRAFKIRNEDIATQVDLNSEKTSADARLSATLQIWEILYIALCAGFGFLSWQRRRKKRAKAEIDTQSEKGQ